jgi:hypothetical protein
MATDSSGEMVEECLLAVDVGLRTGLALFNRAGRLQWYRSQHFPNAASLRRGVNHLLQDQPSITRICIEGGGPLADIWNREARRRNIIPNSVAAETWRDELMYPRNHRTGKQAKHNADALARKVIQWSASNKPTSLRHDTSEAILIGLWAVIHAGWLKKLPEELRS